MSHDKRRVGRGPGSLSKFHDKGIDLFKNTGGGVGTRQNQVLGYPPPRRGGIPKIPKIENEKYFLRILIRNNIRVDSVALGGCATLGDHPWTTKAMDIDELGIAGMAKNWGPTPDPFGWAGMPYEKAGILNGR